MKLKLIAIFSLFVLMLSFIGSADYSGPALSVSTNAYPGTSVHKGDSITISATAQTEYGEKIKRFDLVENGNIVESSGFWCKNNYDTDYCYFTFNPLTKYSKTNTNYIIKTYVDGYVEPKETGLSLAWTNNAPTITSITETGLLFERTEATITAAGSDSDGGIVAYEWDFGDSQTTTTVTGVAKHTWAKSGTYAISVRAKDTDGDFSQWTVKLQGIGDLGIASSGISGPSSANEGDPAVTFTAGDNSNPDSITSYVWNFGDGSTKTGSKSESHAYVDGYNVYTVSVMMTDEDGSTATYTKSITIYNVNPTANAGGPYTCTAGNTIAFAGSASDVANDAASLTYLWDLNNDGTYKTPGQNPSYTCGAAGIYNVNLKVSDKDGGFGTASATITASPIIVPNQKPTVTIGSFGGLKNTNIAIIAVGSDADGAVTSYEWDWNNDGTFEETTAAGTVMHSWNADGTYTIAVRVKDNSGDYSATATSTVTVANRGPLFGALADQTAILGTPFSYQIAATDPDNDPLTYSVNSNCTGLTITPTGLISWNPNKAIVCSSIVSVTDGTTINSKTLKITVNLPEPVLPKRAPIKDIYIGSLRINSEYQISGGNIVMEMRVKNTGDYDLEGIKLSAAIMDIGAFKKIGPFNLKVGKEALKTIVLEIPDGTEAGEYDIRISASNLQSDNDGIRRVKYRPVELVE